jgi:3-oxoacyl-[acyl-carrier protein] reductase
MHSTVELPDLEEIKEVKQHMDLGLNGKVGIITGGSRGIGKACAQALAQEGCNLVICARNEETLEQTASVLQAEGIRVCPVVSDISESGGSEKVFQAAIQAFGTVDILVNNVGGSIGSDFLGTSDSQWQQTFDLNLFSTVRLCRFSIPVMQAKGQGRIINIASIYGRERGGGITYQVAKSAVISFSKSLAIQVAPYGVTVNSIAPGSILFPGGPWDRIQKSNPSRWESVLKSIAIGRYGKPEEIASVVTFLASQQASLVTGACINVDGGQSYSLV